MEAPYEVSCAPPLVQALHDVEGASLDISHEPPEPVIFAEIDKGFALPRLDEVRRDEPHLLEALGDGSNVQVNLRVEDWIDPLQDEALT